MALAMPAYEGLPSWWERVWRTAWMYSLAGAYPSGLLFGVPAYFMLRRHFPAKIIGCTIVGAAVAALPWALLILFGSGLSHASIDGKATVVNGHTTPYGWLKNAEFVLTVGFFGAVGGLVFWCVAAAGQRSELPAREP